MGTQRRQRRGTWLRTIATVASVTVVVGTVFAASVHGRAGASTGVAPPFSVYKNTIVDSSGNPFFIRGAGSPTLTWSCTGLQTNQSPGPIPASDFSTMADVWKSNTVTIYVNQDYWLYPSLQDSYGNSCASYRSVVEQAVADAEAAGLQVILGPPVNDGGDPVPPTQWCAYQAAGSYCMGQWCMPDVNTNTLWQSLAQTFGSDPSVFFELYAEPHNVTWPVWRNGGSITCKMHAASGTTADYTYTAVGMQQLTDTIRATGAENIVLASGTAWAYNLSQVPSHYLTGTNVAYSTHIYTGNTASWTTDVDNLAKFCSRRRHRAGRQDGSNPQVVHNYDVRRQPPGQPQCTRHRIHRVRWISTGMVVTAAFCGMRRPGPYPERSRPLHQRRLRGPDQFHRAGRWDPG